MDIGTEMDACCLRWHLSSWQLTSMKELARMCVILIKEYKTLSGAQKRMDAYESYVVVTKWVELTMAGLGIKQESLTIQELRQLSRGMSLCQS